MTHVMDVFERRACKVISQPRMTQRYKTKQPDRDKALTKQIKELAKRHKRYGYRMITAKPRLLNCRFKWKPSLPYGENGEAVYAPSEMISVMALTDDYVYNGDLMAKLTMSENIMQVSKSCSTNLIGTPQPESRFAELEKVTGKTFERQSLENGLSQIILKNMGTAFGNLGGVEVGNDNYLIYLDGITRTAMATGANFFLNPSWSTIIAACYYGRDIPNLQFKISMLLSTQNLMQFRILLNIISEYIRDDMTYPIRAIKIGNAVSAENFIKCSEELDASGIKDISLTAHMRINPDLGMAIFDWTENAFKVLQSGTNLTFKYESDGTSRELDIMEAYFITQEELEANMEKSAR